MDSQGTPENFENAPPLMETPIPPPKKLKKYFMELQIKNPR
jgi:hypothetical protein